MPYRPGKGFAIGKTRLFVIAVVSGIWHHITCVDFVYTIVFSSVLDF